MPVVKEEKRRLFFMPYEPCPCESGIKYKFCCYSKSMDNKFDNLSINSKRIIFESQKMFREADFEVCFSFDNNKCDSKIIGAHSLQNNGVLDKISSSGHIYNLNFDIVNDLPTLTFNKIGKNRASTFLGFCKVHDKEYFSLIEDQKYEQTNIQNYLFAFRAFCFERHRKFRLKKHFTSLFQKFPQATKNQSILHMYRVCGLDLKDKELEYLRFKDIYEKKAFANLESFVKEVPFRVGFTGTTAVAVNVDIYGEETINIYDYNEKTFIPSLYISVIPQEKSSLIIVSRFVEDTCYEKLIERLKEVDCEELLFKYISFCLSEFSENVYFSPEIIDTLSRNDRDIIISAFYASLEKNPEKRLKAMMKGFQLNLFEFKMV